MRQIFGMVVGSKLIQRIAKALRVGADPNTYLTNLFEEILK